MQPIDISPGDLKTVQHILQEHVPELEVRAFGSRVSWTARETSDLDLALMTTEPLDLLCVAEMREAFDESDLPFRVDLVDWASTSENFRKVIEKEYVVLAEGEQRGVDDKWREMSMEEIAEKIAMGPFGSSIRVKTFVTEGVPIISGQHLHGVRVDDAPGFNFIMEEHARRLKNANVGRGDIIFTHAGNIGQVAYIPEASAYERYVISQRQFYMRCNRQYAVPQFIAYYFQSPDGQHKLLANTSQVGVPSIAQPVSYLRTLSIPLPPLPEQRAIAHVLGTLDDKIEANRRMNQTLEAMAQTLFKSWFIDFDPVHAKATLNNHHSPLEGESARQGRSPLSRRWGVIRRGYTQRTLTTAQTLRRNRTDAEGLLWHYLRNNQLDGHRFRRQHPIGPYIVDFACLARKILIELDGSQHAERQDNDKKRDAFLRAQGYRVLRFWNNEVFENCFGVLERVYEAVTENPPPEPPAPDGLTAPTPPQGGSDWTVERARAYLDGMEPEIAAMFPHRFVDSGLGKIPEGWEVKPLDHCASLNPESWSRTNTPEWVEYVDLANTKLGVIEATQHVLWKDAPSRAKRILRPGDTIVGTVRPGNGSYSLIGKHGLTGSTGFAVLRPVHSRYRELVYLAATTTENIERLAHRADGAAYPAVRPDVVSETLVVMPSVNNDLLNCFSKTVASILNRVESNKAESRTLTALRDVLLPKLISGEIRVSERNICV